MTKKSTEAPQKVSDEEQKVFCQGQLPNCEDYGIDLEMRSSEWILQT